MLAAFLLAALAPADALPPPPPRARTLARVLALEDSRDGGPELQQVLLTGDRGLKRRAALAAARIGDPALLPALLTLLQDPEPEVRQMAAFALGFLGDRRAVEPLLARLDDGERVVRARAVEALGRLEDPRIGPEIARRVLASMPKGAPRLTVRGDDPASPSDPWMELRLGLMALWRQKDPTHARSVLLREDGTTRFDWWLATYVASRLEDPRLAPVLRAAATSSDPYSRALAARGLGALKDGAQLDVLEKLVKDRDEMVVIAALRALGAMGDGRATGLVAPRLTSDRPLVVGEALQSLARLPPDRALRELIVGHAGHPSAFIRAAALTALVHTVPDEIALVLSGMDPDPEASVRAALATALGTAGRDDLVQGMLLGMLKDEAPSVLAAVLEAITRARGKDAIPTLQRHLAHPDPVVRATALGSLTELAAPGLPELALAAWDGGRAPDDVRVSAVDALAKVDDGAARAALRRVAGEDPWRVVRAKAAAALGKAGEKAPEPGREATGKPPEDYRQAMAPYAPQAEVTLFTPRAFLHTARGVVEIHLDVIEAPLTVASFLDLARRGFYDGTVFHRVVPAFVAQGGDPQGTGHGGPGYALRTETAQRSFGRGVVGMASSGRDTEGSQFFLTLQPAPHLDGNYTVFGRVAAGMEVADALLPGDVIEKVEVWTGR
jgi:cyclophilin family peptidyl-prolyl cis-trans isomerase